MKIITNIIIFIAIIIIGTWLLDKMYNANMSVYCNKLQLQAKEYDDNPHFYITSLDYKECSEVHGIIINANIK